MRFNMVSLLSNSKKQRLIVAITLAIVAPQYLVLPCSAKRAAFQMPTYEKMTDGAGPQTNDVSGKPAAATNKPLDLRPMSLDGDSGSVSTGLGEVSTEGSVLKSTVTATGFAPKGPVDPASKSLFLPSKSVGAGATPSDPLLKQARNVNAVPLPLIESDEEAQKKVDTIVDAEKAQLADLWEATLTRSPDIQFVVQKLMPTSNPGHASTVMMRMLSTAIFGAMGAATMMSPSVGMYAANNVGTNIIYNLLDLQQSKSEKKAQISQTEAIMLYNMVRVTADKLVDNYRNYKKSMGTLSKAAVDLQDLQGMISEARHGQDAAKQLDMEYTVRKAQRDLDSYSQDMQKFRQQLVDLSGVDAVVKLDRQLEEEASRVEGATSTASVQKETKPL